jgi:D-alanyl-D-alanine carboxypeptidase/D-alanyl-D-alanine-endopeptidase (penicillin-binding protein 4)
MRVLRAVLAAAGVLFIVAPAPAAAQSTAAAQRALRSSLGTGLKRAGGATGAYAVDMNTGRVLFSVAPGVGRIPASVEKLYTTATALQRFGANGTLTTRVLGVGTMDAGGGWHGTLYLKGGGDPTFGADFFDRQHYGAAGATMQRLVSNLIAGTGITSVQGPIVGDESIFDSLRGTPATGYVPRTVSEGLLSGLAYDRGYSNLQGTVFQRRPATVAAQQFAIALRAAGVKVPSTTRVYTGLAPPTARQLTAVHSPRMATLIALANTPSDNFVAEMLLKDLGARFGGRGTTAAGAAVVRAQLASALNIHPRIYDGSGLSRADSTTPRQVVALLQQMSSNPDFVNSLAVGA